MASSSPSRPPSLVASWLSSIDLGHAAANFEMAGIVTPRSLAELELVHYGPLGVKSAEHRKRLFYLVQRVRAELEEGGGGGEEGGTGSNDAGCNGSEAEAVSTLASPLSERDHGGRRDTLSVLGNHRTALSPTSPHELPERSPARERLRTELRLRRLRRDRQALKDGKVAFSSPASQSSSEEKDLRHVPAPGVDGAAEGPAKAAVVGNAPEGRQDELDSILLSPGEVPRAAVRDGGLVDDELDSILSSPGDVSRRMKNDRRKSGIPSAGTGPGRLGESKLASDSEEEKKEEKNDEDDGSSARFSAGDAVLHRRTTVRRTNAATASGGDRQGEDARWAAARKKVGRRRSGIPGGLAGGGRGLLAPRGLVDDDEESLSSVTSDLSASVASIASGASSVRRGQRRTSLSSSSAASSFGRSRNENSSNDGNRRRSGAFGGNKGALLPAKASSRAAGAGRKRLSTIPASGVAPISPLPGRVGGRLDAVSSIDGKAPSRRRPGTAGSTASSVKSGRRIRGAKTAAPSSNGSVASHRSAASSRKAPRSPARSRSPHAPTSRGGAPVRSAKAAASPPRSPVRGNGGGRSRSPPPRDVVVGRPLSPKRRPLSPKRGGLRAVDTGGGSPPGPRAASPRRKVGSPAAASPGVQYRGAPSGTCQWSDQIDDLRRRHADEHAELVAGAPSTDEEGDEMRIRVIVRKRPMSRSESSAAERGEETDVVQPLDHGGYGRVLVHQPRTRLDLTREVETIGFAFDGVFDERSDNRGIYDRSVRGLIPGVFEGRWASVFAYGQTGSGKTFTMMGSNATGMRAGNQAASDDGSNFGLYFLAAQDVFRILERPEHAGTSVGVSLFEIYCGKLLDLLNDRSPVKCLEDRKGKVQFPGLSEHPVRDAGRLMEIIDEGSQNRSTGTTSANADSSRSHAVLQLSLRRDVGRVKNKEVGRLTFIDLAGSERGADTSKACRTTRMEGAEINTSLLALKEVIRALATGSSLKRIPFRGSKLTQVLKESFVGRNSRTVMVTCVAPNRGNCDHTLNTLRYADRVKERDPTTGELSADCVAAARSRVRAKAASPSRARVPPRPLTAPPTSFRIDPDGGGPSDEDPATPPSVERTELLVSSFEGDAGDAIGSPTDDDEADQTAYSFEFDKLVDSDDDASTAGRSPLVRDAMAVADAGVPRHARRKERTVARDRAAAHLVATHKSILPKMLHMLQHEMNLVNDTDADRANMKGYMRELDELASQQLSLVSTLRKALDEYNTVSADSGSSNEMADYDDSFDLGD